MRAPAWKGCGEKEEENKQGLATRERGGGVRLVVGLPLPVWAYLTGCRWGPAPAASLTGLGSRARDQGRGGTSKRRTGGACRREGRLALALARLRLPRSAFLGLAAAVTPVLPSEEEESRGL